MQRIFLFAPVQDIRSDMLYFLATILFYYLPEFSMISDCLVEVYAMFG